MTAAESGLGPAAVLNAAKETGDSFDVVTAENFGPDKRTRLIVFATGISGSAVNSDLTNDITVNGVARANFAESVSVEARISDGRVWRLPVEFAGSQGIFPGLDQVNAILLPELRGAGTVELTLILGGQRSNTPTIGVR